MANGTSKPARGRLAQDGASLPRRRVLRLAAPACAPFAAELEALPPSEVLSVEDRIYLALERFRAGFHCSQSVLAAYADDERLRQDTALRMAAALAGGSTVGGECGAVSSSYLVLGLKYGRAVPAFGNVEADRELFDRVRHLVSEFRKRHGAITCRELLGVDVFTPEGLAEGRRRGLFAERCPQFIRDAITLLEAPPTLSEERARRGPRRDDGP